MSSLLDQPARKFFIVELTEACTINTPDKTNDESRTPKRWSLLRNGNAVEFSMVTVQGVIVQVRCVDVGMHLPYEPKSLCIGLQLYIYIYINDAFITAV